MEVLTMIRRPVAIALACIGLSGCIMLKSTHCELVSHLDHSADNYGTLATKSGDASDQADAKQMKSTIAAEQTRCQ
jgi:hypothetical protein